MLSTPDPAAQNIAGAIGGLLRSIDPRAAVVLILALPAGNNNRAYRIEASSGRYLAKQYFAHPGDARDRLAAEFSFACYAARVAPGSSPRPFATDERARIALYEFVEGRPFAAGDIAAAQVDRAAAFFLALNAPAARPQAGALAPASEAAFSIAGHLALIDRRIRNLMGIDKSTEENRRAARFFGDLDAGWTALKANLTLRAAEWGLDMGAELAASERSLSPSDFGFHNALRRPDGSVCFLDFEYAGWDDPARMIGDFFAQPAVPVPARYFGAFAEKCLRVFPDAPALRRRAALLRPVTMVKWCCIALGVFLPVVMARRKFANPDVDEAAIKRAQLAKAEAIFSNVRKMTDGLH